MEAMQQLAGQQQQAQQGQQQPEHPHQQNQQRQERAALEAKLPSSGTLQATMAERRAAAAVRGPYFEALLHSRAPGSAEGLRPWRGAAATATRAAQPLGEQQQQVQEPWGALPPPRPRRAASASAARPPKRKDLVPG